MVSKVRAFRAFSSPKKEVENQSLLHHFQSSKQLLEIIVYNKRAEYIIDESVLIDSKILDLLKFRKVPNFL
jgi:hypothetical protein